jgi:acyl-CoA thioesterase-1
MPPATATVEALDLSLSPECRVPGSKLYTLARLKAVKAALKAPLATSPGSPRASTSI